MDFLADYGEDYLKVLVVNVGAAHTREPRLSAALLALGKIFFLRIKEGLLGRISASSARKASSC